MERIFAKNEIDIFDDHAEIILYNKYKKEKARAVIDLDSVEIVKNIRWYQRPDGYVATNNYNGRRYCYLHTLIHGEIGNKKYCDHKDGNKLNNRKNNLRTASSFENARNHKISRKNTSGVVGVHFNKSNQKWCAMISVHEKTFNLGYFEKFEEAVACRKMAEEEFFKEFKADDYRTQNRVIENVSLMKKPDVKRINLFIMKLNEQKITGSKEKIDVNKYNTNEIVLFDDYAEIVLYNNINEEKNRAIIDLEDVEIIKNVRWHQEREDGYVVIKCFNGVNNCPLHLALIGEIDKSKFCRHKDGDRMNNRKSNFEIVDISEERIKHKSGVKNISWALRRQRWQVAISVSGKVIHLGFFKELEDAIAAKNIAEEEVRKTGTYTKNKKENTLVYDIAC